MREPCSTAGNNGVRPCGHTALLCAAVRVCCLPCPAPSLARRSIARFSRACARRSSLATKPQGCQQLESSWAWAGAASIAPPLTTPAIFDAALHAANVCAGGRGEECTAGAAFHPDGFHLPSGLAQLCCQVRGVCRHARRRGHWPRREGSPGPCPAQKSTFTARPCTEPLQLCMCVLRSTRLRDVHRFNLEMHHHPGHSTHPPSTPTAVQAGCRPPATLCRACMPMASQWPRMACAAASALGTHTRSVIATVPLHMPHALLRCPRLALTGRHACTPPASRLAARRSSCSCQQHA